MGSVASLEGAEEYDPRYRQMYVDYLEGETRFVCGDGPRWGIVTHVNDLNKEWFAKNTPSDHSGDPFHVGYIIPAAQARSLRDLLADQETVLEVRHGKDRYQFQTDFGMEIILEGVPYSVNDYVAYTVQTNRRPEAIFTMDVGRKELSEFCRMLNAVTDTEKGKKEILSCMWTAQADKMRWDALGDLSTEWETLEVTPNGAPEEPISGDFSFRFFPEILAVGEGDVVRFHFMGSGDVVFAELLNGRPGFKFELIISPCING